MLRGCFCRHSVSRVMFVGVLLFSSGVYAESSIAVGRYVRLSHDALPAQANLLLQTFHVHFPRDVGCVGDAIRYLLSRSGYRLVDASLLPKSVRILLNQPLPEVHRQLGPLSLRDGLLTLVGRPFDLMVDPVHRCVGFCLKPYFQTFYGKE